MVDRCATYTQMDSDMVRRVPKRRRETERFVTDQATHTLAGPPELSAVGDRRDGVPDVHGGDVAGR